MKQAEVARAERAPTKGSTLSPAPAAQKIENHSEPVVTYTVRNQANNGDANSYDGNDAQQNEPHHDQPQKNNPTFARANSASVKEDGMTITTDAVLARVEGATKDIRDLARFNMREVEVSLASTTSVETVNTTPVATTDTTAQTPRADTSNVEQTQTTSASDDTRRAAANDVRLRALERMVVTAAREGSDTIKMQLYPPGLGQVIIRLNMEGSRLRLSTRTSNADATEALQKIEQGLREALSMNGLDLTQFDVSEDGQERDRAARQQAEQPQPKRGGFSDEVFAIDMNA
jgi:flagellar hook-length control protein FliK